METLVQNLLARRSRIRELIAAFAKSDRKPFPNWGASPSKLSGGAWSDAQWGTNIEQRLM
jgi:hypothetical protein